MVQHNFRIFSNRQYQPNASANIEQMKVQMRTIQTTKRNGRKWRWWRRRRWWVQEKKEISAPDRIVGFHSHLASFISKFFCNFFPHFLFTLALLLVLLMHSLICHILHARFLCWNFTSSSSLSLSYFFFLFPFRSWCFFHPCI